MDSELCIVYAHSVEWGTQYSDACTKNDLRQQMLNSVGRNALASAHAGVDHVPHARVDLLVPSATTEYAVMPHAGLNVVGF